MKQFFVFAVLAFFAATASAQSSGQSAFKKGDKIFNLGLGLGSPYWGSGYSSSLISPTVALEVAVSDELSIGGTVAYSSSKINVYDWKYHGYYIGGRGAYHFDISKQNIDLYAGAGLGYIIVTVSSKYSGGFGAASGVGYTAFGGGRYYLNGKTAVYGELGYGSFSILNAGVSFKF